MQLATDLVAFYEILYATGRLLSDEELGRFKEVCERFGTNYQALREHSRVVELLHFKVTPKVHKMQHLPLLSEVLNPRWVQNYCEESLVGTCTKIWGKSVSGRHQGTAQRNVLTKKIVGLTLRLEG